MSTVQPPHVKVQDIVPYGLNLNVKPSSGIINYGGMADLYLGEWIEPQTHRSMTVALKDFRPLQLHKETPQTERVKKCLVEESRVWIRLDHPNILPYLGYCLCEDIGPWPSLVSPYLCNGTVMDYLERRPDADRMALVRNVICGLQYLHSQSPAIIHGDLHKNNVLIDDNGVAQISDFGSAMIFPDLEANMSIAAGVAEYMAPELFSYEPDGEFTTPYSTKLDIYAFAMVSYEIFTNRTPFKKPGRRPQHSSIIIARIQRGVRPERHHDDNIQEWFWRLLQECWIEAPDSRPTADRVVHVLNCQ